MKKLICPLIIVLFFISQLCNAQREFGVQDLSAGKIERVFVMDSITKDELYSRARLAFTKLFRSSKSAIDYEDKESGTIIAKANTPAPEDAMFNKCTCGGTIYFSIEIGCKDGKYRIIISNYYHEGGICPKGTKGNSGGDLANSEPGRWVFKNKWAEIKEKFIYDCNLLVGNIKNEMNKPIGDKSDW